MHANTIHGFGLTSFPTNFNLTRGHDKGYEFMQKEARCIFPLYFTNPVIVITKYYTDLKEASLVRSN